MDLEKLMKLDLSYPGISFGYHSWSLGIYLETLEDFISHAGNEYRRRAREKLDARIAELEEELYIQELNYIDEAADEHIPSYARMSAIVLIWGIFESTVSDIARYIARRESTALQLREVRANNFMTQIDKYFSDVLGIQLPWTQRQMESLRQLKKIRDAVAHRNGQFMDAAKESRVKIEKVARQVAGVNATGRQLTVGREYVEASSELVSSTMESLNALVSSRYDGPTV